jgi:hypothetical protein
MCCFQPDLILSRLNAAMSECIELIEWWLGQIHTKILKQKLTAVLYFIEGGEIWFDYRKLSFQELILLVQCLNVIVVISSQRFQNSASIS